MCMRVMVGGRRNSDEDLPACHTTPSAIAVSTLSSPLDSSLYLYMWPHSDCSQGDENLGMDQEQGYIPTLGLFSSLSHLQFLTSYFDYVSIQNWRQRRRPGNEASLDL